MTGDMAESWQESSLNEAEAELYDRQLRLWGFEAQQRMQKSKILFCGFRGLFAETAKNLVLAGMNVTLQDNSAVELVDLSALYFATLEEVGQKRVSVALPRLQALNAYVSVNAETTPLSELSEEYFSQFSAILLSDCTEAEAIRVNEICRRHGITFFWAGTYAEEGWFISDFGEKCEYQEDPPKSKVSTTRFPSLAEALAVSWKDTIKRHFPLSDIYVRSRVIETFRNKYGRLPCISDQSDVVSMVRKMIADNGVEFSEEILASSFCLDNWGQCLPVCSVLGGFLSQEVVKAISKIGEPMKNVFVYSSEDFVGRAFASVPT